MQQHIATIVCRSRTAALAQTARFTDHDELEMVDQIEMSRWEDDGGATLRAGRCRPAVRVIEPDHPIFQLAVRDDHQVAARAEQARFAFDSLRGLQHG